MNNANVPRNFNATVIWTRYKFANALFIMGWQITVWDVSSTGEATHCPMRANKEVLSNLTLICPKKKPLTLNLHSTTFISQEGRCCSTADAKPVQLHPPGRETVDGHFISFRPIEPSTARFLTNGRSRVDLSTGQWVLTRCHCVMQSLQNEWPSWQVMGCLKTPWLNNEYIKAHASKY